MAALITDRELNDVDQLSWFELPPVLVRPALRACRAFNTLLDGLFYNVPTMLSGLAARGVRVSTAMDAKPVPGVISLAASTDPEGALLLIDPATWPHITAFDDVRHFLDSRFADEVDTVSITGVGSSALGSAALAWDVALAQGRPVLAIVPGYGMADVVLQAMGGWFGFGLFDALKIKPLVQTGLAVAAPKTAMIGRHLMMTTPQRKAANISTPVFRTGSGSSDVLHDLMDSRYSIKRVVGHSKGALVLANAIAALNPERLAGVEVVTLGCPVDSLRGVQCRQYLGVFDLLGQLNAWGHLPTQWELTEHSTNLSLPLSMDAEILCGPQRE